MCSQSAPAATMRAASPARLAKSLLSMEGQMMAGRGPAAAVEAMARALLLPAAAKLRGWGAHTR